MRIIKHIILVMAFCCWTIGMLAQDQDTAPSVLKLKAELEPYISRHSENPEWIVSRLQMYWQSHATDIYVNGEELDHTEGHAPVPTVRYTASRGTATDYRMPALEDIPPYQDSLGMWMENKKTGGMEWTDPRKTGRTIEAHNMRIMNLARDAAQLYSLCGDGRCAKFAADIFDTYMTGLYYRNVPIDMNHGQQQTLVGLTSFEVIHEDIVAPATECYGFLRDYLSEARSDKIAIYEDAFRKWGDNIVANGVPHNNWDLIQAKFILKIALILKDDTAYSDGHGRQYFLSAVLNDSSIRQWSIGKLIDFGFDPETGIWTESPGYATMVIYEFMSFVRAVDTALGIDLVERYPILYKAVRTLPQYLFPNGLHPGWGDSNYEKINTGIYLMMIDNARQYGKSEQEELFSSILNAITSGDLSSGNTSQTPTQKLARIEDYVSPTFYSPQASWFVARSGMDEHKSLMMSVCGSKGNHAHANGISVELYGKGFVQAPDLGRGSDYTALDYAEFYSQFPAHNTVCVDGVSSYPVMMSHHAYSLEGCYPEPESKGAHYDGVLYGDFYFLEPETQSDQRRQVMIVETDPQNGYYVDVFRSRRQDGQDKMHDYFYHNIGQDFTLNCTLVQTQEPSFAGGHLYAYSYLWDKYSCTTSEDIEGQFTMHLPDGTDNGMKMWIRGDESRTVFKVLSPHINSLTRTPMPYDVASSPCQTFMARQEGEAWNHPFAAVYEPFDAEGGAIATVEWLSGGTSGTVMLRVNKKDGRSDIIFSSDKIQGMEAAGVQCVATIATVSDDQYFMANGTSLSTNGVKISTEKPATVALFLQDGRWHYSSDKPCHIRLNGKTHRLQPTQKAQIQ